MPAVRRGLGALHFRHTRSRQAPFDRQAGERAELDASRSGRKSTAPEPSGDGEARSSARKPTDAYCELPELLPAALPEPAPLPVALVPEGRDDDVEPEPALPAAPEELVLPEPEAPPEEVDALPPPSPVLEELQPASASAPTKSGIAQSLFFIFSPPEVF